MEQNVKNNGWGKIVLTGISALLLGYAVNAIQTSAAQTNEIATLNAKVGELSANSVRLQLRVEGNSTDIAVISSKLSDIVEQLHEIKDEIKKRK